MAATYDTSNDCNEAMWVFASAQNLTYRGAFMEKRKKHVKLMKLTVNERTM